MKQFFTGLLIGLSVMFLIAAVGKGPNMENGGYDGGEVYAGHFPKYMPPYWLVGYMAGASSMYNLLLDSTPGEKNTILKRMVDIKAGGEAQGLDKGDSFTYKTPLGTSSCPPHTFGLIIDKVEKRIK